MSLPLTIILSCAHLPASVLHPSVSEQIDNLCGALKLLLLHNWPRRVWVIREYGLLFDVAVVYSFYTVFGLKIAIIAFFLCRSFCFILFQLVLLVVVSFPICRNWRFIYLFSLLNIGTWTSIFLPLRDFWPERTLKKIVTRFYIKFKRGQLENFSECFVGNWIE